MDSIPKNFAEYLNTVSQLRMMQAENKKVCIKKGVIALLYTGALIGFFLCTREAADLNVRIAITAIFFASVNIVAVLFRWLTPKAQIAVEQQGCLGGCLDFTFRLFITALIAVVVVVTFVGGIILITWDHFGEIPVWLGTPEGRMKLVKICCVVITLGSYCLCVYRFAAGMLYGRFISRQLDELETWYRENSLELIARENNGEQQEEMEESLEIKG